MSPTEKDVGKYIYLIKLNFEKAYSWCSKEDLTLLAKTWAEILSDYPKEICDRALKNALSKATYAPRIGDIVAECEILTHPDRKSEEELWSELMSVKYDVYDQSCYLKYPQHREEAEKKLAAIYDGLNEDLKLFIVGVNELVELAGYSAEDLRFEKNRFFKRMPELKKLAAEKRQAAEFMQLVGNNTLKLSEKN